jgi:hypothetical protein
MSKTLERKIFEPMIAEIQREAATTRQVLERVPEEQREGGRGISRRC